VQPPIQEVTSADSLNPAMKAWAFAIGKTTKAVEVIPLNLTGSWIDVRDCALGHVLSLEKSAAGGERIIVSAPGMFPEHSYIYLYCPSYDIMHIDNWTWQDWGNYFPSYIVDILISWPSFIYS